MRSWFYERNESFNDFYLIFVVGIQKFQNNKTEMKIQTKQSNNNRPMGNDGWQILIKLKNIAYILMIFLFGLRWNESFQHKMETNKQNARESFSIHFYI